MFHDDDDLLYDLRNGILCFPHTFNAAGVLTHRSSQIHDMHTDTLTHPFTQSVWVFHYLFSHFDLILILVWCASMQTANIRWRWRNVSFTSSREKKKECFRFTTRNHEQANRNFKQNTISQHADVDRFYGMNLLLVKMIMMTMYESARLRAICLFVCLSLSLFLC